MSMCFGSVLTVLTPSGDSRAYVQTINFPVLVAQKHLIGCFGTTLHPLQLFTRLQTCKVAMVSSAGVCD